MADYYKILGVNKNASDNEIKKAYKKLAKKWHPDGFATSSDEEIKQAEEKMKEINSAYDVLKDPEKRRRYDMYGSDAERMEHNWRPGNGGGNPFDGFDFGFGDIFRDIFGQSGSNRPRYQQDDYPVRGEDVNQVEYITLEEAFHGKVTNIIYFSNKTCNKCHGKGAEKDSDIEICPHCHGTGVVQEVRQMGGMRMVNQHPCDKCYGRGKKIKNFCSKCHGIGTISEKDTVSVTIPKGVQDGTRVRVKGKGNAGKNGGSNGDLYVIIHVYDHKTFKCQNTDLLISKHISFTQAALGDDIEIPVIEGGNITFKIKPGTVSGYVEKLTGRGMPYLRGEGRGDMYVKIIVDTPTDLSEKQKELLREFELEEAKKEKKSK